MKSYAYPFSLLAGALRSAIFCACMLVIIPEATLFAQWDINPTLPFAVCDTTGAQTNPTMHGDGEGGVFVFWLDNRVHADTTALFGQHYNALGEKLWEPMGREIVALDRDVAFYQVSRDHISGRMHVMWYANNAPIFEGDGIYMQELDNEGARVWEEDLWLATEDSQGPLSAFNYNIAHFIRLEESLLVMMQLNTYGYQRMRFVSCSFDGELEGTFGGTEIGPISYGSGWMVPDLEGGAYVYYSTANGLGAAMMVNRLTSAGTPQWPNWVNATSGTPGLGYQFALVAEPGGLMVFVEAGQTDMFARKLDSSGVILWEDEVYVCNAEGSSNEFRILYRDGIYTIVWRDSRPGAIGWYAIYGQRMTSEGEMLWEPNGMQIANLGSNTPSLALAFGDDESILVHHQSFANGGQDHVHKLSPDGIHLYGAEGIVIAQGGAQLSQGAQKGLLLSGTNIIAAWNANRGGAQSNDILIARVEDLITYIDEDIFACNEYTYQDEVLTESGDYSFMLEGDTLYTIHLTIESFNANVELQDNTLMAIPADAVSFSWVDCDTGAFLSADSLFTPTVSGNYAVTASSGQCTSTSTCQFVQVLIFVDSTITACGSLDLGGIILEESGEYTFPLQGDSILVLNLTIENLEAGISFDPETDVLSASPVSDELFYLWIDCDTGSAIAEGSTFAPLVNGNYAVEISGTVCVDLSDCVFAEIVGVDERESSSRTELFPNPGSDYFTVRTGSDKAEMITVRNALGALVASVPCTTDALHTLDTTTWPAGVYLIDLRYPERMERMRWVKE
jgi:hypothetical protein